jgi:hypothetical protein
MHQTHKKAREQLVAKFLTKDVKGNDIKPGTLQYENLTSQNLHHLTESFVTRLPLFNKEYPGWIP